MPRCGNQRPRRRRLDAQRLADADQQTGRGRDGERREVGDERGGQRGHDRERQRARRERGERRGEDAGERRRAREAIAQFAISERTGHHPSSAAARSFCAHARVTIPNRVNR